MNSPAATTSVLTALEARAARKLHGDKADKVMLEQPEDEAKYSEYRIEKESFDDCPSPCRTARSLPHRRQLC